MNDLLSSWNRFWFSPASIYPIATIRGCLCAITIVYFLSSFADVTRWYAGDAPFSQENVVSFFETANLQAETRWILSPLFLIESVLGSNAWVLYTYLLAGIGLGIATIAGRGGRMVPWALWILFAGWANRILFLAGTAEILLSLCLFAVAFVPPENLLSLANSAKQERPTTRPQKHWLAGFGGRLLAVEVTLFALITWATMLVQIVWWNGYGAAVLNTPAADRTMDFSEIMAIATVRDIATHFLAIALPVAFCLLWCRSEQSNARQWIGLSLLLVWCLIVAMLGSHWLYASTLAAASFAFIAAFPAETATANDQAG